MAISARGKVIPLLRGEYDPERRYAINDIVSFNGSFYWHYKKEETVGIEPTNEETWKVVFDVRDAEKFIAQAKASADTAVKSASEAKKSALEAKGSVDNAKMVFLEIDQNGDLIMKSINEPSVSFSLNENGDLEAIYK